MARLPRLVAPNQPHHVVQTGIDQRPIFLDAEDYTAFLGWLRSAARQFRVAIHAYALMPAQIELLVTPADIAGLGRMMQWVGRQYVPYYNAKCQRAGTLWQGRYRASVIDAGEYFLLCSRYIELAPVRDGLAAEAADYPWTSLAHHVGIKADPLITDHPCYWALGNTPFDREVVYRALLEQGVSQAQAQAIKEAALKGWALGSDKFKAALSRQINRRVDPAKRGRPAKQPAELGLESVPARRH